MSWARLVFILTVLLFGPGCGGGSSGTDGGAEVRFLGLVQDPEGMPLSGATITVLESGESSTSDSVGGFEVLTARNESYTFEIVVGESSLRVVLTAADVTSEVVSIVVTVDVKAGAIRVEEVSVLPIPTPTPAPTIRLPSPGASARPTATAVPDQRSSIGGLVIDQDRQPVDGVDVSLVGTSVADRTGSDGTFSFRTRVRGSSIVLRVVSDGLAGEVTISGLPKGPFRLSVTLQVTRRFSAVGGELAVVAEDLVVSDRE